MFTSEDELRLFRYLLDDLPQSDREGIEEKCLLDEEWFEQLRDGSATDSGLPEGRPGPGAAPAVPGQVPSSSRSEAQGLPQVGDDRRGQPRSGGLATPNSSRKPVHYLPAPLQPRQVPADDNPVERSKQWYEKSSQAPYSLVNNSIGRLLLAGSSLNNQIIRQAAAGVNPLQISNV